MDRADVFVLLDNVQFKRDDWQNRNKIRTSHGWQWLTVPVMHDFGQKIFEVKINNKMDWKRMHLNAIMLNYRRAPCFEMYWEFFKEAYAQDWELLSDVNIFFIEKLAEILGITTRIVKASDYKTSDDSTRRLIDLCQAHSADSYLSGVDGNKYMDFQKFAEQNIDVIVQEFKHPQYPQLWKTKTSATFLTHMSAIDLLLNCGVESLSVLHSHEVAV